MWILVISCVSELISNSASLRLRSILRHTRARYLISILTSVVSCKLLVTLTFDIGIRNFHRIISDTQSICLHRLELIWILVFCIENYLIRLKVMTMIFDCVNPKPPFMIGRVSIVCLNNKFGNSSMKTDRMENLEPCYKEGKHFNHL